MLALSEEKPIFPRDFQKLSPGGCAADVSWDGMPVFFNSAGLSDLRNGTLPDDAQHSPDGITDTFEAITLAMTPHSDGQRREFKINSLMKALDDLPDVPTKTRYKDDPVGQAYIDFITTKSKDGLPTLLWDEPDRSLDLGAQIMMWTSFLPKLAEAYQIIVATHSIIPLLINTKMNLIDMHVGYIQQVKAALDQIKT
jgi:hypothetical protein